MTKENQHRVHLNQQNHITLFPSKQEESECSLGVGDGSGNLFVHGSYEAVKRVQEMIFELEKLKSNFSTKQSLEEAAFECYEKRLWRKQISTDTFKQHIKESFKAGAEWAKKNNY